MVTYHILTQGGNSLTTQDSRYLVTAYAVPLLVMVVIGGFAVAAAALLAAAGLKVGDRYHVCHSADPLPEQFGRHALTDGIWQGGDIFVSVAGAYPDSVGPFWVVYSARTGTSIVHNHAWEQLAADALARSVG